MFCVLPLKSGFTIELCDITPFPAFFLICQIKAYLRLFTIYSSYDRNVVSQEFFDCPDHVMKTTAKTMPVFRG